MKYVISVFVILFLLGIPLMSAQASLVVCGLSEDDPKTTTINEKQECTPCLILVQFKRFIDFIALELTPIFAAVMIVIAGLVIILGGANPELISTGRKMFTNTMIGVLIIYASFMVTNFTLRAVAGDNNVADSWYKLECIS